MKLSFTTRVKTKYMVRYDGIYAKKAPHTGILRALQTINEIISIIVKEDFIYIEAMLCYIGEVSDTKDTIEGKLEEKNSMAVNLLSEWFDIDFVSKMTKLPISEVIKLKKQYEVIGQRKVKH